MPDPDLDSLRGARLILGAKEAGAGSLLAALWTRLSPAPGSLALVEAAAERYFVDAGIPCSRATGDDAAAAGRALDQSGAEAVVVGASAGASVEKRLLQAARCAGIPAHAFVDHYWNLWQRFADERTARRWTYLPDRIHVPAETCRRRIVAQGCPAERVRVFDHPLLAEKGATRPAADPGRARASLGIDAGDVVALCVSEYGFEPDPRWRWEQAHPGDVDALIECLVRCAGSLREEGIPATVVVKLHPAESTERAREVEQAVAGTPARVVREVDKGPLLDASDIAFGLNSMLLLEAARAGVPAYSCHRDSADRDAWLSTIRPEVTELDGERACLVAFRGVAERHGGWAGNRGRSGWTRRP